MEGLEDDEDANVQVRGAEEDALGNEAAATVSLKEGTLTGPSGKTITDKEFYKAMQKLKDRGNNAVPPKKSASAYIIFGKEVSCSSGRAGISFMACDIHEFLPNLGTGKKERRI